MNDKNLFTISDLTQRYNVTKATIRNWEKSGELPPGFFRGGRKYWRAEEIEEHDGRCGRLLIKRLTETAILPYRATDGAAGLDLYADEEGNLPAGGRRIVGTGISMAIPKGYVGLIWPRSGLAVKHGIDTLAGVIDSDYRGEIKVALINFGPEDIFIRQGDRIAQLLVQPIAHFKMKEADELANTARGGNGFGSTGA